MTSAPRAIVLDTDPGGDDCFALLWLASLAAQGVVEWVGVTTVGGNVAAELTFAAASRVLALVEMAAVPVARAAGYPSPKARKARGKSPPVGDPAMVNPAAVNPAVVNPAVGAIGDAAHVHGADGMGNLAETLPDPVHDFAQAPDAADFLSQCLRDRPGEITIVAIGPLTNLAAAERQTPGILRQARELVIMGGAFRTAGNVTPVAEFNIAFDPGAAQTVFAARPDTAVVSLDVTERVVLAPSQIQAIAERYPASAVARFALALARFMTHTAAELRETPGQAGFLVHDATAIAALFYPQVLQWRRGRVQVETTGDLTRGQTLWDRRDRREPDPNAWIAVEVNTPQLLGHLVADLGSLVSGLSPRRESAKI